MHVYMTFILMALWTKNHCRCMTPGDASYCVCHCVLVIYYGTLCYNVVYCVIIVCSILCYIVVHCGIL